MQYSVKEGNTILTNNEGRCFTVKWVQAPCLAESTMDLLWRLLMRLALWLAF